MTVIKKIVLYVISFLILFAISYSIHTRILDTMDIYLRVPLFSIYLFHLIISLLICIGFVVLATTDKWSHQLGFVYLFTFITKLLLFAIFFKNSIFEMESLTKTESFNLLIPVFLFLFLEVYFISRIISKKQY
tara:strand:- start:81765 stop:82163 length:399 start_codon:yes stop_codon:yes gene_type:complete